MDLNIPESSIVLASLCLSFLRTSWAASSCSTTLTPTQSVELNVAPGYRAAVVARDLTKPRSIAFDPSGNLLVVESGSGISSLALQDDGDTCLSVRDRKTLIENSDVSFQPATDSYQSYEY